MQFIYALKAVRLEMLTDAPTTDEVDVLQAHGQYLADMASRDQVLLAGRTQTADAQTFGIVIVAADGEAQARRVMDEDPAVAAGVMTATLYPFQIAMLSQAIGAA
ncbi:MAG: YciI family protein [Pseudomonadota bacterium]